MSRFAAFAWVAFLLTVGHAARAQVFYEPVQSQYFSGDQPYYYGGHNPAVHDRAHQQSHEPTFGRSDGYAFHSASIDTHREVVTEPTRVYSDAIPTWNARVFGYTQADAQNAANANAPTYFRKADLAYVARVQWDGTWVVSSQQPARGTIEIRPYRAVRPAPRGAEPRPILVIPKHLLDKKLWPEPDLRADAR